MEGLRQQLEDAKASGKFEGRVLTSLKDIKRVLDDMTEKHASQDAKIELKVDKLDFLQLQKEVTSLSKWRYISTGAGAAIGWILSNLSR